MLGLHRKQKCDISTQNTWPYVQIVWILQHYAVRITSFICFVNIIPSYGFYYIYDEPFIKDTNNDSIGTDSIAP